MSVKNEVKCHDDSELNMFQSQEDVPGFPETMTNDSCHCSLVHTLLPTPYLTAVPAVPLVPPAQFNHMRGNRDTWDTAKRGIIARWRGKDGEDATWSLASEPTR